MNSTSPKSRFENTVDINSVLRFQDSSARDTRQKASQRRRVKQKQTKQDNSQLFLIELKPQASHSQMLNYQQHHSPKAKHSPKASHKLNQSCQTSSQQPSSKQGSFKKRSQVTLFMLNCIFTLNTACQNLLFFFVGQSEIKYYYLATSICFMNVFFFINAIVLARSSKQFICLSLLIDNILLTQIVASIGFVGLNMTIFSGRWQDYFAMINVPLLHFLLSTNFRFFLLNYKWNRIKTVIYKIVFLLGAIVLFGMGTYIMFVNFKISKGFDTSMDSSFKDFSLLYTFGNFAFFGEMFMKIGDFDKSGDLQFHYHIALDTIEDQTLDNQSIQPDINKLVREDMKKFMQSQEKLNFRQELKQNVKQGHIFF